MSAYAQSKITAKKSSKRWKADSLAELIRMSLASGVINDTQKI